MRRQVAILITLAALAAPTWAQVEGASPAAPDAAAADAARVADTAAQHARIASQRQEIEQRYDHERADCYQKFAVQDCLNDSRRRRRTQTDELNRQETALNDAERKRRGDAALQRLDAKDGQGPKEGARGLQGQADRERQAAERAASRDAAAANAAANRKAFEAKQQRHEDEQAQRAQQAAQADAERASYEARQKKAQDERAERAKRNAERTKPRGQPLPDPE